MIFGQFGKKKTSVSILAILVSNMVCFFHSNLELGMFFKFRLPMPFTMPLTMGLDWVLI